MSVLVACFVSTVLSLLSQQPRAPEAELRKLVATWDRDDSPGGALAVLREGELACAFAFGMADLAEKRANTTATGFYLASVAKPFTALCTALAARKGVLELDDPARKLLPELGEAFAPVTFRHLLQHRSGVPDVYDVVIATDFGSAPVSSNVHALGLLAKLQRPCFPAGERFLYCNSGYVLLAEALARASKKTFPALARELVLEPLEMTGTWYLGEDEHAPRARIYQPEQNGWSESVPRAGLVGPGGMWSTLDDLVRFERAWESGRLPDAKLQKELLTAPERGGNPALGAYGLGWMLQTLGGRAAERHSGGAFGASADLLRFPEERLAVIVLSNAATLNAPTLGRQVAAAVLGVPLEPGQVPAPEPVALTDDERARFGRIWLDPVSDDLWVVTPKAGRFAVATMGDLKLTLVAESDVRLRALDAHLAFALELEDDEHLVVSSAGRPDVHLERVPFPPTPPVDASEYAGRYTSVALGVHVDFAASGGGLRLVQHDPLLPVPPFLAVARDRFLCDAGAELHFRRDGGGRLTGATVVVNRSGPLEFTRE